MSYAGQLFAANDWASLWTRPSLGFDGSFQQGTTQYTGSGESEGEGRGLIGEWFVSLSLCYSTSVSG